MNKNKSIAVLVIRLILGLIFSMQGFGKVFTWGVENVYQMEFFYDTYKDFLPDFVILGTAYYTSYIELIAGFFLIIGFKRNWALYFLASVLVIVTFGHGLVEPIWDLSHVMYRTVLLMALLLLPEEWDIYSIDCFQKENRINHSFQSKRRLKNPIIKYYLSYLSQTA